MGLVMGKAFWAALCAAGALVWAGSAGAVTLGQCLAGCFIPDGNFAADYLVLSNGQAYQWDLVVSDPSVSVSLTSPNEVFSIEKVSNGDGTTHTQIGGAFYSWQEAIAPGHTVIRVRGAADFNTCGPASPFGVVCATTQNVWGNGTELKVSRNGVGLRFPDTVTVYLTVTGVPEPATWAMMLTGFLGLGAGLRKQRNAPATA